MKKYNIDDKIICVKPAIPELTLGKIYKILNIYDYRNIGGELFIDVRNDNGDAGSYLEYRFKKYIPYKRIIKGLLK